MKSEKSDGSRPCERCGTQMKLVRTTPKAGPYPELATFACDNCKHVETIERGL